MRVFVTGATGFIGTPVVKDLIAAGHQVLGMARSDEGANAISAVGAEALRGSLEDLDSLRKGASASDAVIHLGFVHDWSNFAKSCEIDRRAIEALGSVLAGSDRPLIVTGGLAGLAAPGQIATENQTISPDFPFPRVSEQTALSLKGVRASAMRLPQVHDPVRQGLITPLIAVYREKGACAYLGDGQNRWPAAHVLDVARLYRLAIEQAEPNARYHAVAEEGVSMRDIAETIGRRLKLPVKSIAPQEAPAFFGWLGTFAAYDMAASSEQTRRKLGWQPTGPGLIADLEQLVYSAQ
ncbi:SDR family oxidoreductase [Bradyrhizobium elkanii]|uniref:SDR family oxidoreductase n=1 Tax=Bradyrhizobium elkanii TaxID=29448 RepID=UPI0020A0DA54|nr:SDR family oxidoreductase [Bradyrhizobium elkanii]MCP1967944.1 nucleoside-diphosphate-sugar epimerase [Bradyrhizobium elkanii]MCS3524236.1 nucleoside-diphosphate-sugar epimerase [Bradyrhizobium elkanii]MCS4071892.1 nucleoside-diphosphate-sugar epimerase [Bradyrhizobium elkanii]MCS4078524.1 nucleoside-diphosphate-sugar epimerase [Bradyrhizobium elkanii]MCS4110554.1 nucleoside-diphosphate-sugar epimerase [Bradyrhizobium elkanii]